MKKKGLSFIMAVFLLVMTAMTVTSTNTCAATDAEKKEEDIAGFKYESGSNDISLKVMEMLEVISKNKKGDWGADKTVTRAEFSKMLVQISNNMDKVSSNTNSRIFTDVRPGDKYSGYIKLVVTKGWMNGYLGGKFKPNTPISLEEAINAIVQLLGYKNEDFSGNIADAKYELYTEKELDSKINLKRSDKMKKKDCKNLFYNLLRTKNKDNALYGDVFGFTLDSKGEIDYDKKVNDSLKGPIFINLGWEKSIPFKISSAKLYKNKIRCKKEDIEKGDLLYYSKTLKTIWAFDSDSDIDYKKIVDSTKKGPYIYGSVWKAKLPFSIKNASIYKNDRQSKESDITNYDVIYYSKELKTVWAYDENGNIDYLSIINKYKKGPYIAKGSFTKNLLLELNTARVYKNGEVSNAGKIMDYDVVYYSKELKTIWAYDSKVYGVYEGAKPNKVAPTEIVVAGVSYQIGNQIVGYELSTQGNIREGMRVVLLMGDDGTVAGIMPAETLQSVIAGYVIKADKHVSKDSKDKSALNNYVRIVDTNGIEQEYDTSLTNLVEGDVVQVNFTSGEPVVTKVTSPPGLNGKVSSDGTSVSDKKIASNARIIDVAKGCYAKVSVKRMGDILLSNNNVLYYSLNKAGEISDMILLDATGDLFQYGILLDSDVTEEVINIPDFGEYKQKTGTYKYDLYGKEYNYSSKNVSWNETIGPKGFLIDNGELKGFKELYRIMVSSIERNQARGGEASYPISDKVSVYIYNDRNYYPAKLTDITNTNEYFVDAYIDKINQEGGVIRVIVARKK